MKLITLFLLLACGIGAFASFRSMESIFRDHYRKSRPDPPTDSGVQNAPRNCNPKKIPKFRNFNASSITGTWFLVRSTVTDVQPFANEGLENTLLSYEGPDCATEQVLTWAFVFALPAGDCFDFPLLYKFGEGRDSATASRVSALGGLEEVVNRNIYFIDVDTSTGTMVVYIEELLNGEYLDDFSFINVYVRDRSQTVDLSAVREGLVKFCGEEALEDDFFNVVDQDPSFECTSV